MPVYKLKKKLVSPKAEALWPKLLTAEAYAPKGVQPDPKDKGKWSVKLKLNPDNQAHAKFIQQVEETWEELHGMILNGEGKSKIKLVDEPIPIVDEEDEEGNPTGLKLVRWSKKAGGVRRDGTEWHADGPPALLDTNKAPYTVPEGKDLGNGSILRCAGLPRAYQMGGKFGMVIDLVGVMVIEPEFYEGPGGDPFEDVPAEDFGSDEFSPGDGDF